MIEVHRYFFLNKAMKQMMACIIHGVSSPFLARESGDGLNNSRGVVGVRGRSLWWFSYVLKG